MRGGGHRASGTPRARWLLLRQVMILARFPREADLPVPASPRRARAQGKAKGKWSKALHAD